MYVGGVSSVAVTPDGVHVLCGSRDRTVHVFRLADGHELRTVSRKLHAIHVRV